MIDSLFLNNISLYSFIGHYDWEHQQKTKLLLDLEIALPQQHTPLTEDLNKTIDYENLLKQLNHALGNQHFVLIENLAEYIAQTILEKFETPSIKVSLKKLGVLPQNSQVGITLYRQKK